MLLDATLSQLAAQLQKKEISSVDLVKEALQQVQAHDAQLHSFITLADPADVLAKAEQADATRTPESPILHGIPYALKDAYCTSDMRTTAASKVLDTFTPPYDATVYRKMKETGAILIGKNNQDAWGHGGSTENTDYQPAKNPWDPQRIPGGSSGGSAIAVATRMAAFAIGEDTGGSIRNPSSMCNTSGLKVTYGRVSRYGAIAYASSLDTVGPMAKSVVDLAIIMEHIAGRDPLDGTSSPVAVPAYTQFLGQDIKGKVIGLPAEFYGEGLDPAVRTIIDQAVKTFENLGAKIETVSMPALKHGVAIYYLIALSETSSNLARYDGIRYGDSRQLFSAETMRRIMVGSYALSAGYADELYNNAQKARTLLISEYAQAFEKCDVLLAPVTPTPPAIIGELINDPLKNLLEDLYTGTVNVVGSPSLAIPAGFTANKLPVGLQLIGKKFAEAELLQLGSAYQAVTEWHTKKPILIKHA
jgi:aspartyl-tRNA(Asn)/glutamyl-tRNA(Gln) amidotransferase subunit A